LSLKMRLTRLGAKKRPFYRIIVVESEAKRDGKFIEQIGYYDPLRDPVDIKVDMEKAKSWIDRGVIPSDTVKNLLKKVGMTVSVSQ
jgi:small subunit ribosomal protein S16